ncbi:MAG: pyridoxamine 5'-phosphate oxidase [Shimia sp.]
MVERARDRAGIFAGDDPFALTRAWIEAAAATEPNDPNAIQLATVDAQGMPNVRTVLLKEVEDAAFVFYTNYGSRKAREIEGAGRAAFVLFHKTLGRQVRVRGTVSREDGAQADAYYASRGLESRIGAHASRQSEPLPDRAALEAQVVQARATLGDAPPRPAFWGGFRLVPHEMEFWADGAHRLHDRFRWSRADPTQPWTVERLNP